MTLYLLPNTLGPVKDHRLFLPLSVDKAVSEIDGLIAESEGEGRRFLKRFSTKKPPYQIPIALLTKKSQDLDFLLEPLLKGESWGVVSDCGLPCLADPGSSLVLRARKLGIPVKAFAGPSSITHALMLSGLPAQSFSFHGYLPKEPDERVKMLKKWSHEERTTHIFIEAPYRNAYTFNACIETLKENAHFCAASQLTLEDEWIACYPISYWKKLDLSKITEHFFKKPTIFLFH